MYFQYFGPFDFVQTLLACGTNIFKGMYGETLDFRLPMPLHTLGLFDKYSNHMLVQFEQIRMVRTIQNFELFAKNG